jgi:hypothetical protein
MAEMKTGRSGWYVPRPRYLTSPPKERSDVIRSVEGVTGVQEPQVVFDTEDEAVREAGKLLKELRRDAIFREKYASDLSNAVKARGREDQLHEARKHRAIAEEGLKLLGIQLAEADDGIEFTAR